MSDFEWECGICGEIGHKDADSHLCHPDYAVDPWGAWKARQESYEAGRSVPWLCSYCGVSGSYKKGDAVHRCPPVVRDAMGEPIAFVSKMEIKNGVVECEFTLPSYAPSIEVQFNIAPDITVCSHCYGGELRLGAECSCRCHK